MRLFAALWPPAYVLAALADSVAAARRAAPDLRWIPAERWHVTVAFYGEVPDRGVARLERRLTRVARAGLAGAGLAGADPAGAGVDGTGLDETEGVPVRVSLRGGGHFGGRVLWAGVHGQNPGDLVALRRLAGAVANDRGNFRPHVTLARRRGDGGDADLGAAAGALEGLCTAAWTIDALHLVRSHPGPAPRYETLSTYALG
jgi:2'-5' RNA ligase